jgi:hypothetical protein
VAYKDTIKIKIYVTKTIFLLITLYTLIYLQSVLLRVKKRQREQRKVKERKEKKRKISTFIELFSFVGQQIKRDAIEGDRCGITM